MSEYEQDATEPERASRDEETDAAPDTQDESDEDQTAAQAATADGSEEQIKRAERARANYTKRLREIFGDNAPTHDCPACDGLGLTWGAPAEAPPLRQADDAEPCEGCDAFGFTLTGSKNPEQATKPCGRCGGRGWHEKVVPPAPVLPLPQPVTTAGATLQGMYVPGKGFIPYGESDPLPGTAGG